jgi:aryl-alcohol dehydrogenase-like predicted oxidoreductase
MAAGGLAELRDILQKEKVMNKRILGKTELEVSELCMGTMQFGWTADEDTSHKVLNAAYEAGINFIDTADIYSNWVEGNPGGVSEEIIGNWMEKHNIPRDKVVLATKVRGPMSADPADQGLSRAHILKSAENSLKRMKTDYIDLYQAHWFDEDVPIEETLGAFDELVKQGKVRYIGCSNYPAWRLMQSLWAADVHNTARFNSLQPHYNLVHRKEFESELAEVCCEYQIGVIPYSPLAGGFLTGKYRKSEPIPTNSRGETSQRIQGYFSEKNWDLLDKMEALGNQKGIFSISQVALAWLLANPVITSLIIGPKNLEQLEDNLGAVDLHINQADIEVLNKASE